jgi:hypothetical protein
MIKRFSEYAVSSSVNVDVENGRLNNCKLLGWQSRNGRRYKPEAAQRAIKKYDGTQVVLDHQKRSEAGEDRSVRDIIGVIRNPRVESDGVYGSIDLLKTSEHYNRVIEFAQKFPKSVGFSHEADGESFRDNDGTEVIESITSVFAVALVSSPATTNGIFESAAGNSAIDVAEVHKLATKLIDAVETAFTSGNTDAGQLLANLADAIDLCSQGSIETESDQTGRRVVGILAGAFANPAADGAADIAATSIKLLRKIVKGKDATKPETDAADSHGSPGQPGEDDWNESRRYAARYAERNNIGNYDKRFAEKFNGGTDYATSFKHAARRAADEVRQRELRQR